MQATLRKPRSKAERFALVLAVALVILDLRAHPEFVPPIIFAFSLGLASVIAGALLAAVMIAWRSLRQAGPSAGPFAREDFESRRER
jgi:hypothetical protein